jgi:molybdopterin biosynthesis enzyme
MTAEEDKPQRIVRFTPLAQVLDRIDEGVGMVDRCRRPIRDAANLVLADDIVATSGLPASARALRDGYAVFSEQIADAGSYAPVLFAAPPARVDVGDVLPPETDAVAPLDAVVERDGRWEAVAPVVPGEGVLAAGADIAAGTVLGEAGGQLRNADIVTLTAAGHTEAAFRVPRVCVMRQRTGRDAILDAAVHLVESGIKAAGGCVLAGAGVELEDFWKKPFWKGDADFLIAVGGTGSGRDDTSVRNLARSGRVEAHGIAISPGETAAFGYVRDRPALLIPGRVDAAFAVWHLLGQSILDRLSLRIRKPPSMKARLSRKVASALGYAEVVPVRLRDGEAEPIASGYLPLSALAQADGWILVPPDSEGYPPGAEVVIRPCA